jgi:predicted nucleic acid-binding protein
MIILDSDIIIDFLRNYPPAIEWLASMGDEEITLPGYVVMELVQGCTKKKDLRELKKFISGVEVIWPSPDECDNALKLLTNYNLSHGLGLLDALIGQTALSLYLPLHTFNRKHYEIIPDLVTIQPYLK